MKRFVEPPHNRLERHSLHTGTQYNPRDGGIVQLAGEQRGDMERRTYDDLVHVKPFLLVETLPLGNFGRQFVKTHCGDPYIDDFGVCVRRNDRQREGENRGQEYWFHQFVSPPLR